MFEAVAVKIVDGMTITFFNYEAKIFFIYTVTGRNAVLFWKLMYVAATNK